MPSSCSKSRGSSVLWFMIFLFLRKVAKYGLVESYNGFGKTLTSFPVPSKPRACYFTGAGVFFFWQVGAAKYMKETCVLGDIPVVGASAGSLTGLLLLSGVDFDKATEIALTQSVESGVYNKQTGLAGELGGLLYAWLDTVVPKDLDVESVSSLHVAVTPAAAKSPKLVRDFESREDVIQACMASCHVPVFMDGRPTTSYRGESVVDGSFWYFVTKNRLNGLPLPPSCKPEEVFWVDYTDDDEFMAAMADGNFLGLVGEEGIRDMVAAGYNFMKREHFYGRLPMARFQRPSLVMSSLMQGIVESTPERSALAASVFASSSVAPAVPATSSVSRSFSPIDLTKLVSGSTSSSGSVDISLKSKAPRSWSSSLPTFAQASVKWFLAGAGGTAVVEGLGPSIVNVLLFSLALTSVVPHVV